LERGHHACRAWLKGADWKSVGQEAVLDFTLKIAPVAETVTVQEEDVATFGPA